MYKSKYADEINAISFSKLNDRWRNDDIITVAIVKRY